MIYVIYEDEGPLGYCHQSMDITCNWHDLHIFDNYKEFKQWADKIPYIRSRKRPRISWVFSEDFAISHGKIFIHENGEIKQVEEKWQE